MADTFDTPSIFADEQIREFLFWEFKETRQSAQPRGIFASTAEPFTWVWLADKLAAGAVQWIGGRLVESLFGGGNDLDRLVREIVRAFAFSVRAAIQENELQLISAEMKTLQTEMSHYLAAPTGLDRLFACTTAASGVVSKLELFGLAGHGAYLIAVGSHIAVLQERARAIDRGERANVKHACERGIAHVEGLHLNWRSWHDGRYSVAKIFLGTPDGGSTSRYFPALDGNLLSDLERPRFYWEKEAATQILIDRRDRDWESKIYLEKVKPSEEVIEQWRKLAQSI